MEVTKRKDFHQRQTQWLNYATCNLLTSHFPLQTLFLGRNNRSPFMKNWASINSITGTQSVYVYINRLSSGSPSIYYYLMLSRSCTLVADVCAYVDHFWINRVCVCMYLGYFESLWKLKSNFQGNLPRSFQ